MTSVTDQTRRAVWVTLCDLEYNRRYYTALGDRYRSCHRRLRFGILASVPVEGAILYAATDYSWLFIPAIMVGIVLAALTVWTPFPTTLKMQQSCGSQRSSATI